LVVTVTDAARFNHLPRLSHLKLLVVGFRCPLGDAAVLSLAPSLRYLHLQSAPITPAVRFDHLPALEEVDLDGCGISDAALLSLSPTVKSLRLQSTTGLSPGISLAHLPRLENAMLSAIDDRSPFTDATVTSLPATVTHLDLNAAKVTAAVRFDHLPALESVNLTQCALSDEAIASLPPTVRRLSLYMITGVSPAVSFAHLPLARVNK